MRSVLHEDGLSIHRAVGGEKSWAVRSSFCVVAKSPQITNPVPLGFSFETLDPTYRLTAFTHFCIGSPRQSLFSFPHPFPCKPRGGTDLLPPSVASFAIDHLS